MGRKAAVNQQLRKEHTPAIVAFLNDLELDWEYVHGFEWHIRVQGIMDIFPTSNRYHFLKTDARGSFKDYEELGRIFSEYAENSL
jgi:hypothetical protein